jgi:hypothetical protein
VIVTMHDDPSFARHALDAGRCDGHAGSLRTRNRTACEEPGKDDREHRSLRLELAAQRPDVSELRDPDNDQQALIASLRREAAIRDEQLAGLRERLGVAEHELEDLRAIRDALTPPELPHRPGLIWRLPSCPPRPNRSAATSTSSSKARRT